MKTKNSSQFRITQAIWVIISIILLVLTSCSSPQEKPSDIIHINPDEFINTPSEGTDWIEAVKFISLETSGTHFVPDDAKTKFRGDYILMGNFDRILIFTSEGKFVNEIFRKGGGPEEYLFIADYDLVPEKDEIVIVANQSIIFYTIDGKFIEKQPILFRSMSVSAINTNRFAYILGRERNSRMDSIIRYQFIITDRKGNILQQKFEFPFYMINSGFFDEFAQSADSHSNLFALSFDLSIYELDKDAELTQKYKFDLSPYNPDTSFLQQPDVENDPKPYRHNSGKFTKLRNFVETTNTLGIQVGSDKLQKMAFQFINRTSGNQMTLVMDERHWISEFQGWPIYPYLGATTDWFYQSYSALDAVELLEKLSPEQKTALSKSSGFSQLSQLKEDDNRILLLYKVKDF